MKTNNGCLLHQYKKVEQLNGGDYPTYKERCSRCNKDTVATYNALTTPFLIDRIDSDKHEQELSNGK